MRRGERDREVFDRRELLRRAGMVGGAALLGSVTAGCTSPGAARGSRAPTSTTSTTSTEGPPDWTALAASLGGDLVVPADAGYATAKDLYNEQFDDLAPAAIAYCTSPTDVQRCIDFVRTNHLAVAARSGGHSYGGYSSTPGLVVDVTRMAQVGMDTRGSLAAVGSGIHLIDLYQALGADGMLVPAGSCPTVGIAGLTLGGGVGVFGRKYGLTCDNLISAQLVTADAKVVTCDATHNSDLYWACRGGGGGNFGIVTSFSFRVHPIPQVALFTLDWPWTAAPDVLAAWQHWLPGTPDELWSNCQLLAGAGTPRLRVTGVYCGTAAALTGVLGPLRAAVGGPPTYDFVGSEPYLHAMLIEAGCDGSSVAECHLPSQDPAGTLSRAAFVAKSSYISSPMGDAGISAVVGAVGALATRAPGAGGGFVLDSYGGAINRVPSDATAFVHRSELAGLQYSATWAQGAPPSLVAAATAWLDDSAQQVAPYVHGAYQNYIDPTLVDWAQAYYGANLPRLVEVKRSVDPDDVFHFAQSIPTHLPA